MLRKTTALRQLDELVRKGFDGFINLCDGAQDEDRPGIEVVQALERYKVPFTGAASHFYEPTRQQVKAACRVMKVNAPNCVLVDDGQDPEGAAASLNWPLFVKHPNSYGSIGLTRESKVEHPAQLHRQVERMRAAYGGALIEEFIDGREFTVLVAENPFNPTDPVAYPPLEFLFPAGETFRHFELKWMEPGGVEEVICNDVRLAARLKEAAKKVFLGLRGNSYARCDFRMDSRGGLHLLDINPNCGVFYPPGEEGSADRILLADPGGHRGFAELILQAALVAKGPRPS